ncbi:retron Ec67 family RNA-directed DNA polymerase/endonuclease [Massilia antarctica]|uniref:retron Ec67 family RNA-directed DNA polymerase/endonuclease n=1 Tax=Massilia antarctica TaxID=2765360 RepID=UPI0006BB9894|nr:retron Ec67 family RNA-directed DNA polymerase/endonuclease [Massilia sp. H27-R4]MCY0915213.1 retron Ec67 family RNA-directed DNA polymerase/endonuclease [Massilia sp. H27-R4]CUI05738.1 Retron-type RNA-directed DNA polymerase [Janthinobacterium sp. CG23_2]CUU29524.1 Retron-type RNA-directed DNA polymerase [Janthinobacterium sp. CG23_2]
MILLAKLRSAKTIHHLAAILGFKASALAYILYGKGGASNYKKFDIPKRYGGARHISAPMPELKLLQSRLSDVLQNCLAEINEAAGRSDKIFDRVNSRADRISHGFRRHRSIITNAREHRNRKFVLNVDLKDFFGSINFGRVRGYFIKDKKFLLSPEIATMIAQIACYENTLPQGSPCSPILSNLIGHVLDVHLVGLAAKKGCVYSRYADDLTFSTSKPVFPSSIASSDPTNEHLWLPGKELVRLVEKSGFEINPSKTRMQYRNSRQEVTGLIVNKKVNVRSEYRNTVRAMVHHLFTTGTFEILQRVSDGKGGVTISQVPGKVNQLHGMLGFIDGVDLYNKKLIGVAKGASNLPSKETMYRRFLLYKEFYATTSPVIVCEGKTDNIYILHAIRSLAATYPKLATTNADGTIKLNVRIFKYSGTSTGRILKMHGGTGDLGNFMLDYRTECARFKAPGQQSPVIFLVDNDSGASSIYNIVKQITKKKVTGTEPFVHVTGNLYLCATPLIAGATESMIEDFFDSATKAITIGGKTFDPDLDDETAKHYGKVVFAHKVIRANANKIDFKEFNPILSNIVAAIDAHSEKVVSAGVP